MHLPGCRHVFVNIRRRHQIEHTVFITRCKVRVYHRLELSMGLEQPSIDRSRKWKEKEAVLRCGLLWLEGTGFLAFIYDKAPDKSGTKPAFGDVD